MRTWIALLALLAATAMPANAGMIAMPRTEAPQWTIVANARIGATVYKYTTKAWVYRAGPSYRATLYAVGPYTDATWSHTVGRFDEILKQEPDATVFNGGWWDEDPFVPAGLLLVDGRLVHSPWFARRPQGYYVLDTVLCLDKAGHMEALGTGAFAAKTFRAAERCSSAVQTGPTIVKNGLNATPSSRTRSVRTIVGLDAQGALHVVIFQQPVHLLIAAEFLRGRAVSPGTIEVRNAKTPNTLTATGGLGLVTAVNLNGDTGAVCYSRGRAIIGYSSLALPSALAVRSVAPPH